MARFFRWRTRLRRFGKAKDGVAAVEFGFVAIPFFLLLIGSLEVAMMGFAQTSLDFAVSETGRQIRTGRAQQGGMTAGQIKQQLCDNATRFIVLDCDGSLYLDVDRYDSYMDAAQGVASPIDANGQFQSGGFGYNPGASSEIVVVRAYYRWQVITPLFQAVFANNKGGDRVMVSTMMFRNEPFGAAGS